VVILSTLSLFSLSYGNIWASMNLAQSHASSLANMYGLFKVLLNLVQFKEVSITSKLGVIAAILGATILCFDPEAKRYD
tara:strand:+ start:788 stop:1024 length:237 start_codon:yes stop_codon:yes gene_type:complete